LKSIQIVRDEITEESGCSPHCMTEKRERGMPKFEPEVATASASVVGSGENDIGSV
jgi:hypothetical protein